MSVFWYIFLLQTPTHIKFTQHQTKGFRPKTRHTRRDYPTDCEATQKFRTSHAWLRVDQTRTESTNGISIVFLELRKKQRSK
jgi:hypothetical protein